MNLRSIKRNRAEFGRLFAGILAVILIMVIPLKSLSRSEADSQESFIRTSLNHFVNSVSVTGCIYVEDYEKLVEHLSYPGGVYSVEIMLAEHQKAIDEYSYYQNGAAEISQYENDNDIYVVSYTDEVLDRLYSGRKIIVNDNQMITVKVVCLRESAAMKVCNMFYGSEKRRREYIAGWKR